MLVIIASSEQKQDGWTSPPRRCSLASPGLSGDPRRERGRGGYSSNACMAREDDVGYHGDKRDVRT